MEKEIVEESKIIKAASSLKSKITKENIKKYSSKYRTPFDNKIIAIVASIISTCCMLFVDAFEFAHKYDYSFKKIFMKLSVRLYTTQQIIIAYTHCSNII